MLSCEEAAIVENTALTSPEPDKIPSKPPTTKQWLLQSVLSFVRIFFPSIVFAKFFISAIIPTMSDNIIPLFFTGNIPNESGLAVAFQFTFISIILKVIEDGVCNSLFHFVGTHYERNVQFTLVAFKLSIVVLIVAGIFLTVMMILFTPQFVDLIDTPKSIAKVTEQFLYISAFSLIPLLLKTAFTNYLLISKSTWLVVAQIATVFISFFINFFMFGQHTFSLHWGIEKLGIYKVIQSVSAVTVSLVFFFVVEKMGPIAFFVNIPFFKDVKTNLKAFFEVAWGNFAESIVRNFFYFVVILKFINNLGEDEAAAWNLFISIIWGMILIPLYVVANYLNVCIGHDSCSKSKIKKVAVESATCLTAWILLMTTLTIAMWSTITTFLSKSNEHVATLSLTMLHNIGWIFIIFAYNHAINSFFLGTGKTRYIFYQSFLTNIIVYFVPWTLYLTGVLIPTYWWVMGLYVAALLVHFSLASYYCITIWQSFPVD